MSTRTDVYAGSQTGELAKQCVVVTGASSGIGASVSRRLAAAGVDLILLGRDRTRLERVAQSCGSSASVRLIAIDFAKRDRVARLVKELQTPDVPLRAIIHAAGEYSAARLIDAGDVNFHRLIQVNVEAGVELTLALRNRLATYGDVVFINSSIVSRPALNAAYYAASKHALRALADSLREELNGSGIRVTSIFPGRTATPMQEALARVERNAYRPQDLIQPEDIAQLVWSILVIPRTVEVTDVHLRAARRPAS